MNPYFDCNKRFFTSTIFRKIEQLFSFNFRNLALSRMIVYFSLVLVLSCKKDQLPPETRNGANTLGCMIGDISFTASNEKVTAHYYQKYNTPYGFTFVLNATKISGIENVNEDYINISLDSVSLTVGAVYPLRQYKKGAAIASYRTFGRYPPATFITNAGSEGELRITYFNLTDRIISGTFWFTSVNTAYAEGEKLNFSKGRFDVKFK